MKRKDLGKRKGGIFSRFGNWVAGSKPPTTQEGYIQQGHSISSWSSEHDNTPLDGDRYVNGKCCTTVGEYKAALTKSDPTMGGWSG